MARYGVEFADDIRDPRRPRPLANIRSPHEVQNQRSRKNRSRSRSRDRGRDRNQPRNTNGRDHIVSDGVIETRIANAIIDNNPDNPVNINFNYGPVHIHQTCTCPPGPRPNRRSITYAPPLTIPLIGATLHPSPPPQPQTRAPAPCAPPYASALPRAALLQAHAPRDCHLARFFRLLRHRVPPRNVTRVQYRDTTVTPGRDPAVAYDYRDRTTERERIQGSHSAHHRRPSAADIAAEETDGDSDSGASSHKKEHRSLGRKLKDHLTGTTHEERAAERARRMSAEREMYRQHRILRRAMHETMRSGRPHLLGRDENRGKDLGVGSGFR
ncbi:hypothetical protein N0V88_002609 [Collariella sp. IMI 366227]|nr:hypothetical protein N0V88_002609 [Collariella sp. IMI 366227]